MDGFQSSNSKEFSVLISIYTKENPLFFERAIESIWDKQTLKPDEIVIVKDGPLTKELDLIINNYSQIAPIKCVSLDKNYGLGIALARGVEHCNNEIIARMDTDDIAQPNRFEKQIRFLLENPNYDVVGSNIAEFNLSEEDIVSYRRVPEHSKEILKFAKRRNPMNHMSIVFRKKALLNAGSYVPLYGYEDYFLWVRMLQKGSKFYNIQEDLILARIGNNMLARRQGIKFFKQELNLQKKFYEIGFINKLDMMLNIILRSTPRLFPIWILKIVYKTLRN
jgi:glycosyltransferase involved in cell wall biosynthesis